MLKDFLSSGLQEIETVRLGMYKNFRVGVIKYFQRATRADKNSILVEMVEACNGSEGEYFATYNLCIEVDERFAPDLDMTCVGKWVLIGFYMQSFRTEKAFSTVLKLRHYEELTSHNVVRVEVFDHRSKDSENQTRTIYVPDNALNEMRTITKQTKYTEYGKR